MIRVELLDGILPTRTHEGDAGFDLHSAVDGCVPVGQSALFRCGFRIAIPDGWVGFVCSRSGLARNFGVTVVNQPGVIDSGFRGEMCALLRNDGDRPFYVKRGGRIAQLVIVKLVLDGLEAGPLPPSTRGDAGWGSSGE